MLHLKESPRKFSELTDLFHVVIVSHPLLLLPFETWKNKFVFVSLFFVLSALLMFIIPKFVDIIRQKVCLSALSYSIFFIFF